MRVVILSESANDERIVAALLNSVKRDFFEVVDHHLRVRQGYESLRNLVQIAVQHCFVRPDVDSLVLVLDSNHTPISTEADGSRLRDIRERAERRLARLRTHSDENQLRICTGLAAPALEAWLLCPHRKDISEAAWIRGLSDGKDPYTKRQLKEWIDADKSLGKTPLERRLALINHPQFDIDRLRRDFPIGFGLFADSLLA